MTTVKKRSNGSRAIANIFGRILEESRKMQGEAVEEPRTTRPVGRVRGGW